MTRQTLSSSTYVEPLERDRSGHRILAVGLRSAARDGIAAALEARGRTPTLLSAPTPEDALDRLDAGRVDCVIGGGGLALLDAMPDDGPPILLYVDGEGGRAGAAVNAGADGYFEHADAPEHYDAVAERIETVAADHRSVAELTEACRMLLRLTEYTNDALWMFNGDWSETAIINDAYESVWNRSIDDLIDDSADFLRAVHPDDRETVETAMARLSGGDPAELEYRIEYDGEYHWLSVHTEPVFDEAGDVEYVAGFTRDVTPLKERAASMRALNERSMALLEARESEAVAELTLDIVESVVDCSLGVVRTLDAETERLEPVAATDAALELVGAETVSDLRATPAGTPLSDVFRSGEPVAVTDEGTVADVIGRSGAVRSLLLIPLGDHGVLGVGSPPGERWGEYDRDLLELLGRTATAALDRVERDKTLEAYRERLEQSNENLQQFAYIASHDLQEPLRMVSSYVDLLDSEYGDELDEEAREYMDYAVDGATRMKEMIDGLLAYSRVETKGSTFERVDTTEVVETTLQELSLYLDDTELTVEYDDLPAVRGDATQIGQVFQNLIKNAAEHGGAGTVRISATEDDDRVELIVADDGEGIPEGQRESVFDIFEQGQTAASGSGIGLAVCKRIVARHDGAISVGSGPDGGAAFRITLPRAEGGSA